MAAVVSSTARVTYLPEEQPVEWQHAIVDFSKYGEIARLDVSLSASVGCVFVTFYDVRVTAKLLHELPGRVELYPGLPHDFRAVKVNMASLGEKMATMGGFGAFGEVANCSVECGDVIVEFFDMRSAQKLLSVVGPSGSPWPPLTQAPAFPLGLQAAPGLAAAAVQGPAPGLAPPLLTSSLRALAEHPLQSNQDLNFNFKMAALTQALQELKPLAQSAAVATEQAPAPEEDQSPKKLVRTKVANKDFAKYDIEPEKIQSGEDLRTTVMVRNLTAKNARADFLQFLEIAGLSDRYTFFYMPYKEHRNVLAGFAFVNLVAPKDVEMLCTMVNQGAWRAVFRDPNVKAPAVSYARFQGHDQLVKHFSTSAVLHEEDAEKRPIFRPNAGQCEEDSSPKTGMAKSIHTEAAQHQPAFVPLPDFGFDGSKNLLSQMLSNSAVVGA